MAAKLIVAGFMLMALALVIITVERFDEAEQCDEGYGIAVLMAISKEADAAVESGDVEYFQNLRAWADTLDDRCAAREYTYWIDYYERRLKAKRMLRAMPTPPRGVTR